MKNIGLIEDNESLRAVFTAYFNASSTFDVVFSAGDIKDALQIKDAVPQILLLDVDLPSGSGIDAIPLLQQNFPGTKIIILSSLKDANLTKQAIQNGAWGYLLKTSSLDYINESLMRIDDEGRPFSPETISHLFKQTTAAPQETSLTKRELEIVRLMSEGKLNKLVADELCISHFTVNQHLKHIYKKLNVNSKPELVAWYLSYAR
ncbi:LuxR family two component transcriptional regulator [Mucilaginibacter yixingensis]|uniref:LuxR family two component transcriptional regulator n=1 Tax=Mucilaginibacter yixingensis TaxID=1295612 RepID=A0A2T5J967_9SPHI|nr:response regulator transcription factor [Mucilaginibacter yixingensis]PTQ96623.1 LuxR family two component transcriptional regulator [Mucilaginibacter yixingensis]